MLSCLAILALMPMMLTSAELKIDHVTAAGDNLKRLQDCLRAVGIPSEYGGPHSNRATEMAITSFPDGSYLELIAPQSQADPDALARHTWSKYMRDNAGPCAWAVRVSDIAAELARLRGAGIPAKDPNRGGRVRSDGVKLEWETAEVGAEGLGVFFPFLIRDFTPREKRAYPSGKPSTKDFTGITRVVIAVRDLKEAGERYRKAFDLPQPVRQIDKAFGARLALLGGTPVILATPLTLDSWLAERLDKFGEAPCAFVLGARRPDRYKAASKTVWFSRDIFWFDTEKAGWRLGFE